MIVTDANCKDNVVYGQTNLGKSDIEYVQRRWVEDAQ